MSNIAMFKIFHSVVSRFSRKIFDCVSDMINDSDLDGNKMLDFDEFLGMMCKKVSISSKYIQKNRDMTPFIELNDNVFSCGLLGR